MNRSAEDLLRYWLQARGWLHGYAGWSHSDLPDTVGGLSTAEAYHRQNKRERAAAVGARDKAIRDADVGAEVTR